MPPSLLGRRSNAIITARSRTVDFCSRGTHHAHSTQISREGAKRFEPCSPPLAKADGISNNEHGMMKEEKGPPLTPPCKGGESVLPLAKGELEGVVCSNKQLLIAASKNSHAYSN